MEDVKNHSVLVGTKGSKPNSSTGITNSLNFPSYALTIWECALLIYNNYYSNSYIKSFLSVSTSSNVFYIPPNIIIII